MRRAVPAILVLIAIAAIVASAIVVPQSDAWLRWRHGDAYALMAELDRVKESDPSLAARLARLAHETAIRDAASSDSMRRNLAIGGLGPRLDAWRSPEETRTARRALLTLLDDTAPLMPPAVMRPLWTEAAHEVLGAEAEMGAVMSPGGPEAARVAARAKLERELASK